MSQATLYDGAVAAGARVSAARSLALAPTFWAALAVVLVLSLPNLVDPIIRHDDFPALFAEPEMFWTKTLHEGRWINYIWHLRGFETPSWLNFAVYQMFWALFAAATAVAATRNQGPPFHAMALAVLIVVSPSAGSISLWFNTLIPGLALLALFAVMVCRLSDRATLLWLPVFVILGFMAYTMYPVMMLAVVLFRQENRSLSRLLIIIGLFGASFLVAVLMTYTLNWQVHGVFGVPLDDWRAATPASDLKGLFANLPKLWEALSLFVMKSSYNFGPTVFFHFGFFLIATLVLLRYAPLEALYLYAGLLTGLALVAVQVLKMGVMVPPRAFVFAWMFYATVVVRATQIMGERYALAGRMARNAVVLIAGSSLLNGAIVYSLFRPWQAETRAVAQLLADVPEPILVMGKPSRIQSALDAGIQSDRGFQFRMRQLAGRAVTLCAERTSVCDLTTMQGLWLREMRQGDITIRVNQHGTIVDVSTAMTSDPEG